MPKSVRTNLVDPWLLSPSVTSQVQSWFEQRAASVDRLDVSAQDGLVFLADLGLLSKGVPSAVGGDGDSLEHMAEVISTVAGCCLTSAFVLWSHRMFLTYVVAGENEHLKKTLLPGLLRVEKFGASGLANVMKYAASIENLSVVAKPHRDGGYALSGHIPWASNLVTDRFVIAIAAGTPDGDIVLAAIPSDLPGVVRGNEHPLIGLGGTVSASLQFEEVRIPNELIISSAGERFLSKVRPVLMLLQSAMAWGLAQASLDHALPQLTGARTVLANRGEALHAKLQHLIGEIRDLCRMNEFDDPLQYRALTVRKELTELVTQAVWLEIEAAGGAGYVASSATARRLREAAFFPIQSPSLVQLTIEINRFRDALRRDHPNQALYFEEKPLSAERK